MSDEWGPWFEHDGRGCPLAEGTFGEAELRDGRIAMFKAMCGSTIGGIGVRPDAEVGSAWTWGSSGFPSEEVLRYRIRKPRGLTILEDLLAQVDQPSNVPAPVGTCSAGEQASRHLARRERAIFLPASLCAPSSNPRARGHGRTSLLDLTPAARPCMPGSFVEAG